MVFWITQFGGQTRKLRLPKDRDTSRAKQETEGGWATWTWVGRPNTKPKPCQTWSKASLHTIEPKEGRLAQMEAIGCRPTWQFCQMDPSLSGDYSPTIPSRLWPDGGMGAHGGNLKLQLESSILE